MSNLDPVRASDNSPPGDRTEEGTDFVPEAEERTGRYSMPACVSSRLRELDNEDHLDLAWRETTEPSAHDGVINGWRRV